MLKKLIVKWLLKAMDQKGDYFEIDEEAIEKWLATNFKNPGFREYVRKRDLTLLKTIGAGDFDRLFLGQRFEILKLTQEVDRAYRNLSKKGK